MYMYIHIYKYINNCTCMYSVSFFDTTAGLALYVACQMRDRYQNML